jgi:hypothetical protein
VRWSGRRCGLIADARAADPLRAWSTFSTTGWHFNSAATCTLTAVFKSVIKAAHSISCALKGLSNASRIIILSFSGLSLKAIPTKAVFASNEVW